MCQVQGHAWHVSYKFIITWHDATLIQSPYLFEIFVPIAESFVFSFCEAPMS